MKLILIGFAVFNLTQIICTHLAFSKNTQAKMESIISKAPPLPSVITKSIIDIHTHIACQNEASQCYVNKKFKKHFKYKVHLQAFGVTQEELEKNGDEIIANNLSKLVTESQFILKAVVLAMDGFYDQDGNLNRDKTQLIVPNSFVLNETKKHTNLLYAASIHPLRKDALSELEKAKSDGAVFIKWIPCIMGIDPESIDSRMTAFYQKLIDLNLHLLSHTGDEHSFMESDDRLCDPAKLRRPLELGVKVIAAHLGTLGTIDGEENLHRMQNLLDNFPKLTFDISSLVNVNKFNHIKYALSYPGRHYYGSDYPLIRAKLLGIPLSSKNYYYFKITKEWRDYIGNFKNEFDQDLLLKMALGVPMVDLERSQELLREHSNSTSLERAELTKAASLERTRSKSVIK